MPAGYVYVLVNSSMPGLVKVGKTTKDPIERAGELSGVTGVATPFVLVFKQFCNDCNAAELQIHRALEVRGHRISSGREFFRAEANDVIRLVIETANTLGRSTTSNFRDADTDILSPESSDEFTLASSASYPPWRSLLLEADDLRYGVKDQIEDPTRALSLYKDAIRLGALVGYERVGSMYEYGQGTSQNRSKALEYYRTGTQKGNYYCWAKMASLFHNDDQDENATKCWKRFLDARSAQPEPLLEENPSKFVSELCDCCIYCMLDNEHASLLSYLRGFSSEIREYCDARIAHVAQRAEGITLSDWYSGVRRWISGV